MPEASISSLPRAPARSPIAAIRWRNVMGQRFLYLYPGHGAPLDDGGRIPIAQTEPAGAVRHTRQGVVGFLDGLGAAIDDAIEGSASGGLAFTEVSALPTPVDAWGIDPEIVNARGGAIAIGHPLGASGARVVGTLVARMREERVRWGVAAICIGALVASGERAAAVKHAQVHAALAADHPRRLDFVRALWARPVPTGRHRYYDGMLYMMALLHAGGRFRAWWPDGAAP